MTAIKRALISVSDKAGIVDFAKALAQHNVEILSTGGTAKLLADSGLDIIEVSDYTGFPEMMSGRVKTLHPRIHGGILGRRGTDDEVMRQHDIQPIDLLVVNLYPFEQTVANPDCDLATAIENIDIGGPTMLRAAAKNHADVAVITDPADYDIVLQEMTDHGGAVSDATRFSLALKVFEHTARYDGAIANYLGKVQEQNSEFSRTFSMQFRKVQDMRYGENPHQQAAFYVEHNVSEASIATTAQIQGKALSYNNVADTDAALECVKSFTDKPACVIVKHANPCGVALGNSLLEAYERAFQGDPTSAFGGIIAFNRPLDAVTAKAITDKQFVEVIIAPAVERDAEPVLSKKSNVRVLVCGDLPTQPLNTLEYKRVTGGLLVQDRDNGVITESDLEIVSRRAPTEQEMRDLLFSWKVVKYVKSNAIVYGKDEMTVGIGAGQMSRVYSAKIAAMKAEEENLSLAGAAMASDAFFPFRDGIDAAAEVGIKVVIQPGGSKRDKEVIQAADEHDMAMVFTGMRHFRH